MTHSNIDNVVQRLMSMWVEADTEDEAVALLAAKWGVGDGFNPRLAGMRWFSRAVAASLPVAVVATTQYGPKEWGVCVVIVTYDDGKSVTDTQPPREKQKVAEVVPVNPTSTSGLLGFLMSLWVEAETEKEAMHLLSLKWGIGNNFCDDDWFTFDTTVRVLLGYYYKVYTRSGPKKWGVYRVDVHENGEMVTFRQPDADSVKTIKPSQGRWDQ